MQAWRPSPLIWLSVALHALLFILLITRPALWPWLLGTLLANHALLGAAGMWPKSTLLGPNLTHLPAAAAARGEVAITIDDGPDPEVTPQVLAILAAHGARATFFCIGERAAAHPELILAMVAAGHAVENHGQHHRNHLAFSGLGGWLHEVGTAQATLEAISGEAPRFYRALAGLRNPFLDPVLHQLGLQLATWTRRGYDARSGDSARVLQRLTQDLGAGDILLLHDGNAARSANHTAVIIEVLPALLAQIAARQLKPVTLRSALPCKAP